MEPCWDLQSTASHRRVRICCMTQKIIMGVRIKATELQGNKLRHKIRDHSGEMFVVTFTSQKGYETFGAIRSHVYVTERLRDLRRDS